MLVFWVLEYPTLSITLVTRDTSLVYPYAQLTMGVDGNHAQSYVSGGVYGGGTACGGGLAVEDQAADGEGAQ